MVFKSSSIFSLLMLLNMHFLCALEYDTSALGGFAISIDLLEYVLSIVKPDETILELGSGSGTGQLARFYNVYSIEHEEKWLDQYDSTYIYAPIKNYGRYRWYDEAALIDHLPNDYSLILIDGPPGPIGRYGFYHHLNLFKHDVPIIFDDTQRKAEFTLLKDVADKLNRPFEHYECSDGKKFGVIHPASYYEA